MAPRLRATGRLAARRGSWGRTPTAQSLLTLVRWGHRQHHLPLAWGEQQGSARTLTDSLAVSAPGLGCPSSPVPQPYHTAKIRQRAPGNCTGSSTPGSPLGSSADQGTQPWAEPTQLGPTQTGKPLLRDKVDVAPTEQGRLW